MSPNKRFKKRNSDSDEEYRLGKSGRYHSNDVLKKSKTPSGREHSSSASSNIPGADKQQTRRRSLRVGNLNKATVETDIPDTEVVPVPVSRSAKLFDPIANATENNRPATICIGSSTPETIDIILVPGASGVRLNITILENVANIPTNVAEHLIAAENVPVGISNTCRDLIQGIQDFNAQRANANEGENTAGQPHETFDSILSMITEEDAKTPDKNWGWKLDGE